MTAETLKMISDGMAEMGINYGLGEYAGNPITYPYFEGEYNETEGTTENGLQESTFKLMGYSRGTFLDLEILKEQIRSYFNPIYGKRLITDDGTGIAVMYAYSSNIPSIDLELKRIQVNLSVKEWRA